MAQVVKQVEELLSKLKKIVLQEKCDVSTGQDVLKKLKRLLIKFQLVPPFGADSNSVKKQLLLARETLELGAMLSIEAKDVASFERHVTQLKTYYHDYGSLLPESERKMHILGLNLLGLLAQNQVAEFHTELELISLKDQENMHIKYPIKLEQNLMEGSYNKVLSARSGAPKPSYKYFLDHLDGTVREKIAECAERSYLSMHLDDALKLLMLDSPDATRQFVDKRGWQVGADNTISFYNEKQEQERKLDLPSRGLIQQQLGYATELERIV